MKVAHSKSVHVSRLFQCLRRIARLLKLNRVILHICRLRALTFRGALAMSAARYRYLNRILEAEPILAGMGMVEVHMLLHHKRIYEGIWSLYSFAHFCGRSCRIVIHDDGTLTESDVVALHRVFPQCQVIDRRTADSVVLGYFHREGLSRCAQLRQNLIFALKLFDPFFFLGSRYFILLDSDVLFFSRPNELIDGLETIEEDKDLPNLYSTDNGYRYCIDPTELASLIGKDCIERFNPGVLRVRRGTLNFQRIEQYLQYPLFWAQNGTGNYYAELTLWAMELTIAGAHPLPDTYAICPSIHEPHLVSGHYCGGGYWKTLYYSQGLPSLVPIFIG